MGGAPHRIRRQAWQIRAGSAAEAFALRGRLREAWEEELLPAFERAFDRMGVGEAVVRIPRVELRVSVGGEGEIVAELSRQIQLQLEERLRALLQDEDAAALDAAPGSLGAAPDANRFVTLLHYLRTGVLPWEAAVTPSAEAAEMLRSTFRAEPGRLVEALRRERDPEPPFFRLVALMDESEVSALIGALSPGTAGAWGVALRRLLADPNDSASPEPGRPARLRAAAALLAGAVRATGAVRASEVVAVAVAGLSPEQRSAVEALLASAPGLEAPLPRGAASPTEAKGSPPRVGMGSETERERGSGDAAPPASGPGAVRRGPAAEPVPLAVPVHPAPSAEREGGPGTSAEYAGLVLLHPFLVPLFRHTGVAGEDGIPEHALPRAAALLHHAATGRVEVHEFELGLIKLLLGLPPDAWLPVTGGLLDESDVREVEELLRSVIGHWSVLKRTSIEGLRSSFLRRRGLLHWLAHGWQLRLEPAPFDMLLDHLPWGVGIVRLPWMPEPIFTEWTTR